MKKEREKLPLHDVVEIEDDRTTNAEQRFEHLYPLRNFRGNYGVPRVSQGQVIKGFFQADPVTLDKLDKLHDDYISELERFMEVSPSQTKIAGDLFVITQPYIVGHTFEDYIKKESKSNVISTYQTLLDRALNFVCNSDKIVGIDQKPENYMKGFDDKDWKLIDTFPPFMSTPEVPFGDIFYLRTYEKAFADKPQDSFFRCHKRVARRFCLKTELFTDLDLCDATMDVLKQYDPSIVNYWGMFRRRSKEK